MVFAPSTSWRFQSLGLAILRGSACDFKVTLLAGGCAWVNQQAIGIEEQPLTIGAGAASSESLPGCASYQAVLIELAVQHPEQEGTLNRPFLGSQNFRGPRPSIPSHQLIELDDLTGQFMLLASIAAGNRSPEYSGAGKATSISMRNQHQVQQMAE